MPFNYDATWAEQSSAPDTPATGKWKLYPKSDGFYAVDDAGAEHGPFSSEKVALLTAATELTISAGSVTATQSHHQIDTQADAASDDLDTINGGTAGELLYIRAANDARTVVVKHGTGNIVTPDGNDIVVDSDDIYLLLLYDGSDTTWKVVAASGTVKGVTGTTDNAIIRADGTGNHTIQASGLTISDGDTLEMADNIIERPVLKDFGETVNAIGAIGGGTQDIDLESGNVVTGTVDTSETTFTFSNPPASGTYGRFRLILTNGGSQTVNWPAGTVWAGGTGPSLTASGVDVLEFFTIDAGTTWYGLTLGLNFS